MGKEIERKFLVIKDSYKNSLNIKRIIQGYLNSYYKRVVRIRIYEDLSNNELGEQKSFITIKGKAKGIIRNEFEYEIPLKDGQEMIDLCEDSVIEKIRYTLIYDNKEWVVDEFFGDNSGLVIAEIELNSEDEQYEKPDFIGKEVSLEHKYSNSELSKKPYKYW